MTFLCSKLVSLFVSDNIEVMEIALDSKNLTLGVSDYTTALGTSTIFFSI